VKISTLSVLSDLRVIRTATT